MLNDFFGMVACVSLKRRPDRRENIYQQATKLGFSLGYFDAFDGQELQAKGERPGKPPIGWSTISMGNYGNVLSQRALIETAIDLSLDSILILEDDCDFRCTAEEIDRYLDRVPRNWDMVYFGGNHQQALIPIDDIVGRCTFTLTAHAVGIRKTMYEKILWDTRDKYAPIDLYYGLLHQNYNVYCPLKGLATQLTGYSDIESKDVDYSNIIT